MNIYIGHSSKFEYEESLYEPLRNSNLLEEHNIVLPHETEGIFDSKSFLDEKADIFIAEVSKASTGLGIELGWAEIFDVKTVLLSREGSEISSSLDKLEASHIEYEKPEKIPEIIKSETEDIE